MLAEYSGTLILISHDRDFLDRIATSTIVPEGGGRWIEYAGGYTDMVAQRGGRTFAADAPVKAAKPSTAAKGTTDASGEPRTKKRLSFKDKHALETLPAKMASLEKDITSLQATLSDSALYAKDRQAFEQASTALVKVQGELAEAEHRWLELEMLRDEIETARES